MELTDANIPIADLVAKSTKVPISLIAFPSLITSVSLLSRNLNVASKFGDLSCVMYNSGKFPLEQLFNNINTTWILKLGKAIAIRTRAEIIVQIIKTYLLRNILTPILFS